jgi:cell wall-associated NlpC family hydrolase
MKTYKVMVLAGLIAMASAGIAGADFQIGDQGTEVLKIQKRLTQAGFKVDADGVYGQDTARAVKKFQKRKKLDVDGVVGPATYKALTGKKLPKTTTKTLSKSVTKSAKSKSKNKKNQQPIHWGSSDHMTARERAITEEAKKYIGVPYRFGGVEPGGFDCSGFIQYVYGRKGVSLPRSADEQYGSGRYVSINSLEPGDLVFFSTYTDGVSHSGIYMGDGEFISATTSRGIAVADMKSGYWFDRYVGAKRVL